MVEIYRQIDRLIFRQIDKWMYRKIDIQVGYKQIDEYFVDRNEKYEDKFQDMQINN